jgi:hypothetical protein
VTKAAVQAEYRINGSNQRDTGHWIWSAPPAAMAEQLTIGHLPTSVRIEAIADVRFSTFTF